MAHILSKVFPFIASVFGHWQRWLSGGGFGGVIVIVTSLIEKSWGKLLSKRGHIYIFVVAFFLCSCFLSWVDMSDRADRVMGEKNNLQQQIDSLNTPHLFGSISETYDADAGSHRENMFVNFYGIIENRGAPSIATNIEPSLHLADGRIFKGILIPPASPTWQLTLRTAAEPREKKVFKGAEYLPTKAIDKPIPTNGAVTGYCPILFLGVSTREARGHSTLVVQMKDINGVSSQMEISLREKPSPTIDISRLQDFNKRPTHR